MADQVDAKRQVQAMLDRGWRWDEFDETKLVHPEDHSMFVTYDQTTDRLSISPALSAALELVIPTPAGQSKNFWRTERKVPAPKPWRA